MFSRKTTLTLIMTAILGLSFGCSKHANDDSIANDIQSKIAADPVARESMVTVAAQGGKVTLIGAVKDPNTQQRIEQIAHEEPGATSVEDDTAVMAPPAAVNTPPPAPAPPVEPKMD